MKIDPRFIDRKSIRRYGRSRSDTRTCLLLVLALMDPCGKRLFYVKFVSVHVAWSPNLTSIHLDGACAADAKVRLARRFCWLARWSHHVSLNTKTC